MIEEILTVYYDKVCTVIRKVYIERHSDIFLDFFKLYIYIFFFFTKNKLKPQVRSLSVSEGKHPLAFFLPLVEVRY